MACQADNKSRRRRSQGVTLIELLVSVALTLVVILAIVRVFDLLGGNVTQSRSILELSAQLRNVSAQVQLDLDRLTADPAPQRHAATAMGYFEIIEGPRNDRDNDGDGIFDVGPLDLPPDDGSAPLTSILQTPRGSTLPGSNRLQGLYQYLQKTRGILGDTDDIFMGTIRSETEPFSGRLFDPTTNQTYVVQSKVAEVAYWLAPVEIGNQFGEFALVRRVLLVQPEIPGAPSGALEAIMNNMAVGNEQDVRRFMAINDVSMRPEFNPVTNVFAMKANTLADLRIRRHRFAHWSSNINDFRNDQIASRQLTFPDRLNPVYLVRSSDANNPVDGLGNLIPNGNDVLAQDLIGFDLRVFDPIAPIYRPNNASRYVLTPRDPGFYRYLVENRPNPTLPAANYGAYVDLGYAHNLPLNSRIAPPNMLIPSHFSERPNSKSRLYDATVTPPQVACVYDTWTEEYERDGVDQTQPGQPGSNLADEGRNGTEESLIAAMAQQHPNIVDDYNERETLPPYDFPLQGMEVVLRMREASSDQVRQSSVVTNFDN